MKYAVKDANGTVLSILDADTIAEARAIATDIAAANLRGLGEVASFARAKPEEIRAFYVKLVAPK